MIIATIMFYVFAALTILSGVMVVSVKNPVHAVLFLIFAFFNSAGLFVLLGAELIAMLLVIVYVGAVAVLFLFVVMMLDINFAKLKQGFLRYLPVGIFAGVFMFAELFFVLNASSLRFTEGNAPRGELPIDQTVTNAHAIGNVLYTDYAYLFQLAGLVLLVAMIGAIVLTHRTRKGVKKQNIGEQIGRRRSRAIRTIKMKPGRGV